MYVELRLKQNGLDKNLKSNRSENVHSVRQDRNKNKKHDINWRKILKDSSQNYYKKGKSRNDQV